MQNANGTCSRTSGVEARRLLHCRIDLRGVCILHFEFCIS
jgi:hypothetical protein